MSALPMDGTRTRLNPDGTYTTTRPTLQNDLQRNAVIDQLAPPPAGAQPRAGVSSGSALTTGGASAFDRGGKVKQLPSNGTKGKIGNLAAGVGSQVAGKVAGQAAQNVANLTAGTLGTTALKAGGGLASGAAGMGIGIGTDILASKLRSKEDTPEFGTEFGSYTDDMGRRFQGTGGGIASNAVKYAGYGANPGLVAATGGLSVLGGAAAGAIKGAITKHAKSAYTDFKVEDAAKAIKAMYEKELGRPASDDEVQGHLVGVGWDPKGGDRWVGEKSLTGSTGILSQIRNSAEAKAFKETGQPATTRAAVVNQLGTAGTAGAPGAPSTPTAPPVDPGKAAPGAGSGSAPAPPVDPTKAGGSAPAPPLATNDLAGRGGADVPGSAPAPPSGTAAPTADGGAGSAPPVDTSTWDTDGYSAPAYTPPQAGPAPPGWDAEKWNNPDHQTPKYGVGRILSNFPPTLDGLKAAMGDIEKAYPGTTYDGKDKLTIPGVGTIDVLQGAGKGGEAWRWDDGSGGGAEAGGATAAKAPVSVGGGGAEGGDDLLAQLQAEIDRITKGNAPRSQVMSQLGQGA